MNKLPIATIIGRPNVGKSSLFNCLTRSRQALVAETSGLTRDRQYGYGMIGTSPYIVIDTGGISGNPVGVEKLMQEQVTKALIEAAIILFVVDGTDGLTPADEEIAIRLRHINKPVIVVVNKLDKTEKNDAISEFSRLGQHELALISATHKTGIRELANLFCHWFPKRIKTVSEEEDDDEKGIRVAIVGRPNSGKSTLLNQLLQEQRMLTSDQPGTTRDSITVKTDFRGQTFSFIDTAGLRRRSKVQDKVEKFSAVKTINAIENADITILLIDASVGITELDLTIASLIIDIGRALIVAMNKWDILAQGEKKQVEQEFDRRAKFLHFAKSFPISAMRNRGIGALFDEVEVLYQSVYAKLGTTELNRLLQSAVDRHSPTSVSRWVPKLRYVHVGGHNPFIIVIHGNNLQKLAQNYRQYLENTFRRAFRLYGVPIRIKFRSGENPFADRKNTLSSRQIGKKRRLMRFVKQ